MNIKLPSASVLVALFAICLGLTLWGVFTLSSTLGLCLVLLGIAMLCVIAAAIGAHRREDANAVH